MLVKFFIYGLVQGVGFRYFTWKQAKQLGIKGTVCNRADGSVEVIAQGNEEQIKQFSQWLQHGPKTAKVNYVKTQPCPNTEIVFDNFSILRK